MSDHNASAPAVPITRPRPPDHDGDAERPVLSAAECADLLGISRWLVHQAVRDGTLPSVRLGRRVLIPRVQLQAWLDGGGRDTTRAE